MTDSGPRAHPPRLPDGRTPRAPAARSCSLPRDELERVRGLPQRDLDRRVEQPGDVVLGAVLLADRTPFVRFPTKHFGRLAHAASGNAYTPRRRRTTSPRRSMRDSTPDVLVRTAPASTAIIFSSRTGNGPSSLRAARNARTIGALCTRRDRKSVVATMCAGLT